MSKAPNMVVFLSDNHNRAVSGCYGHRFVKTPSIDSLSARGVRFASAYSASPLCVPARAALATGRFPHQTGYWDNAIAYDGRVTSWMKRLRDLGHTVTSIGKLHYRSSDDDNGMTEEIMPMHLHEGRGAVKGLLRGFDAEKPKDSDVYWNLYVEQSTVGTTPYQEYDRDITSNAIGWLRDHARDDGAPWVLFVSYTCPHPPFSVPSRILDLYPEKDMPLPVGFTPADRSEHTASKHLRQLDRMPEELDESALRKIAAGYFGLITYMDEQVGQVLKELENLDLLASTRIAYTSDHGELFGSQGIFGKRSLFEGAVGVPLLFAGPGIDKGRVSNQLVSHVDLYPTFVELAGEKLAEEDSDLPGVSLLPALQGQDDLSRPVFAEYHAQGSKTGAFMVRSGTGKLIYHVGMPPEIFDLADDPDELRNLADDPRGKAMIKDRLEILLNICDPAAVDSRAKAAQREMAEFYGGREVVAGEPFIMFTPPPNAATKSA